MFHIIWLLGEAAILGVMGATCSACAIGLVQGTDSWCALQLTFPMAAMAALPIAIIFGLPAELMYRKLGWRRWWQYAAGGVLLALPVWWAVDLPFEPARGHAAGLYFESLVTLGSGAFGAVCYWKLSRPRSPDA